MLTLELNEALTGNENEGTVKDADEVVEDFSVELKPGTDQLKAAAPVETELEVVGCDINGIGSDGREVVDDSKDLV